MFLSCEKLSCVPGYQVEVRTNLGRKVCAKVTESYDCILFCLLELCKASKGVDVGAGCIGSKGKLVISGFKYF